MSDLQQSALVMKIMGWGLIVGTIVALIYPAGFLWGSNPAVFPFICWQHPPSPYDGLHPYVFMIAVLYLAWAILMIRGAKDPKANAALFDYGILANLLHGLLMIPQAFIYPNEHAHLWADIPMLLAISVILWIWHPNRVALETSRA
jgi:hypothetical protein